MLFDYLDPLKSEIDKLEKFIHSRGSAWRPNETETRSALVNPLLKALGWDPADPALVSQEYQTGHGPADYALLGLDARPAVFIEAKKLGSSLSNHQQQMVKYAFAKDVPYAGLTNGNHWEFYQIFNLAELKRRKEQRESGSSELNFYPISPSEYLEHRHLLQVSIADDSIHDCALKLLLLSRSASSAIQPTQANSVTESVPNPEPAKAAPSSDPESKNTKWIALSDDMFRGRISGGSGDPPLEIKFPDEHKNTIRVWKDILMHTAEWLDSKGLLVDIPIIYNREGQTCIVNTEQNHPNGKPFRKPRRLKRGLWMETRGGKRAVVVTCNLLRACSQNPAEVKVRVTNGS